MANMAQCLPPGSIVVMDWHQCRDSKDYFQKIMHKKRRKIFGLMESPVMPPHLSVETVHYKIFLCGKSGVGKTALAARLAGLKIPTMHYETTGIETIIVYWPVKLQGSGRVIFFCLQLWDCGDNVLHRFDHLLPACKEDIDAILFLFSFADRTSFNDLSHQINQWDQPPTDHVVKLVFGTKFDLFMHCDVAERDIHNFQETRGLPVLRFGAEVGDGLSDIAPILNCLAENLWHKDSARVRTTCPQPQQGTTTALS